MSRMILFFAIASLMSVGVHSAPIPQIMQLTKERICQPQAASAVKPIVNFDLKSLEQAITPHEFYITFLEETCAQDVQPSSCRDLHNWVRDQIQPNHFRPTARALKQKNRQDWSILANKILAHLAIAYQVAVQTGMPAKATDQKWFTERLTVLRPKFESMSPYPYTDRGKKRLAPHEAHNMFTAHARAKIFVAWAFQDRKLADEAARQWPITLFATREDGSFVIEARRGARALYYSLQVQSDLIAIYFVATLFGMDLEKIYPETKGKIERTGEFILKGLADFKQIEPYARENFMPGPHPRYAVQDMRNLSGRLAWIEFYKKLWPKSSLIERVDQTSIDARVCTYPQLTVGMNCQNKKPESLKEIIGRARGLTIGIKPSCFLPKTLSRK